MTVSVKKIKGRALQVGAKIGVVAPASSIKSSAELEQATSILIERGYLVELGASATPMIGDLAVRTRAADLIRQADLERFWQDDTIQAIWCLRGGYGSLRILPNLWYGLFAKKPKIIVGFSDITALEMAIWSQVNLVTFHGPVLTCLQSEFTTKQAINVLSGEWGLLEWPLENLERYIPIHTGKAQGIILGGNLTTINSLMGTRFLPDFDGAILFLEEVGEQAYRIDRMLSQLVISGILDTVAAVIIGQCIPPTDQSEEDLIKVFTERLNVLACPVAYGFPIGHIKEQWTIPQGALAEVDITKGSLVLLENPVK
jgi:muramoyltetrapeptide carboxypeptidase